MLVEEKFEREVTNWSVHSLRSHHLGHLTKILYFFKYLIATIGTIPLVVCEMNIYIPGLLLLDKNAVTAKKHGETFVGVQPKRVLSSVRL